MTKNKFFRSGIVYFVALLIWIIFMVVASAFTLIDFVICGVLLYLGIKNYSQYKKSDHTR
ncbi:hypothetical protein [Bacillus solitudinis]|uniref:hypothetical protein n=1 Tax=Bacillus solitudinis TaxID=2014074 RepID=UPI000C245EA3|nr:hypothetical protein [Bacillus solitudinis]